MKRIAINGNDLDLSMVPKKLRNVSTALIKYDDRPGHYFYVMGKDGVGFRIENNHPRHVRRKFMICFGYKKGTCPG